MYFINQPSICVKSTFCTKISIIRDEIEIMLTLIMLDVILKGTSNNYFLIALLIQIYYLILEKTNFIP